MVSKYHGIEKWIVINEVDKLLMALKKEKLNNNYPWIKMNIFPLIY